MIPSPDAASWRSLRFTTSLALQPGSRDVEGLSYNWAATLAYKGDVYFVTEKLKSLSALPQVSVSRDDITAFLLRERGGPGKVREMSYLPTSPAYWLAVGTVSGNV